jgi:hypothetical protein|tara:strand:- start:348 stop:584 length:237 start_codon:yes stop_codon:yes gene_type:complete
MNEYIPVENSADLVRESGSKAIINRNKGAYDLAIKRAKAAQQQRDEIRDTTREINSLKCEMHEIKSLLQELVGKQNGN